MVAGWRVICDDYLGLYNPLGAMALMFLLMLRKVVMDLSLKKYLVIALLEAFAVSLAIGIGLIRFRAVIQRFIKSRGDHLAVQASHTGDPLRLGGVPVVSGILFGTATLASLSSGDFSYFLFLSLLPLFFAGFFEDIGFRVSVRLRFLASVFAASIAVVLLGHWISRGDLLVLDVVMGFVPAGVFFTILLAALFCHAVNFIDGMNGLAATAIVASALGIAYVAAETGFHQAAVLALLLAAATLGFQLLNWPSAKLFLGDAGAYGLGHILIWLAISVIASSPGVAVPAMILISFYPFADLFHTVLRRVLSNQGITKPDRMHLHQKIRRGLEIIWIGRGRRHISNPLTTALLLPMIGGPVLVGALYWDQPVAAWVGVVAFSIVFAGSHVVVTRISRRKRKRSVVNGFSR